MGESAVLKSISMSNLPGFPRLVTDLYENRFPLDFGFPIQINHGLWEKRLEEESAFSRPRQEIADAIKQQHQGLDLPEAYRDNLTRLGDKEILTVVTGQQVGLGGGPLLTLYKSLTTIKLARRIEEETGIPTIPLFWMATSDHNLVEAAQVHWINLKNELTGLNEGDCENRKPVGGLPLGSLAERMLAELDEGFPPSEFKSGLLRRLTKCYSPGLSFADAFRRLGVQTLGRYGLIFADPEDPAITTQTGDFWERAVKNIDDDLARLLKRSTQIRDAGYSPQAPAEPGRPAIFYTGDGIRQKVVLAGRVKRSRSDRIISRAELLEMARNDPQYLSAGVTFRPMYQAFLFPVGAYVAGPHEIAYWTQLADSFDPLELGKPAIIPRISLTLIERKVKKKLKRLHLEPDEILLDNGDLIQKILGLRSGEEMITAFNEINEMSQSCFSKLKALAVDDYAGLNRSIETAFNKINYQVRNLENKYNQQLERNHQDLVEAIKQLHTHIRPKRNAQERVLSPHYYLARYGDQLIDSLLEMADYQLQLHHFIDLERLIK